jgi:hypothetical protein
MKLMRQGRVSLIRGATVWIESAIADADRLRSLSKDTPAKQGGKKVVHKLQRWIRLSANDRPEPSQ